MEWPAAEIVTKLARARGIDCALAGGVAVQLYGFTRATVDVDMIAAAALDALKAERQQQRVPDEQYLLSVG